MYEMRTVSTTDLKADLDGILQAVSENGDRISVERDGPLIAFIVPIDSAQPAGRRPLSAEWWEGQRKVAEELERNLAGRPHPDPKELIDAGRD